MEDHIDQLTGELAVFEAFPYLVAFPFSDYMMELDTIDDYSTSGIDPVIINAASNFVKPEFVNFNYTGKYTKVTLSFYTYDIIFISENIDHIKKLDSVREDLDRGLDSESIVEKILMIKNGERFLKKIGSSLVAGKSFNGLLDALLKANDITIDDKNLKKIKSMFKTVDYDQYDEQTQECIKSYYDIHLHHIKVLLGIVIAKKIH